MQTTKMNLVNIQGKLSRTEMKNIMAGSGGGTSDPTCKTSCYKWNTGTLSMDYGTCSVVTNHVGNETIKSCDCSLSGGSNCNPS